MKHPEQELQISIVYLSRLVRPEILFFHIPNGGKRTKVEAGMFKRMGLLPGVPDLGYIVANGRINFMELKIGKAKPTEAQGDFAVGATQRGCEVWVVTSVETAREALARWYEPFGYKIPRLLPGGFHLPP